MITIALQKYAQNLISLHTTHTSYYCLKLKALYPTVRIGLDVNKASHFKNIMLEAKSDR